MTPCDGIAPDETALCLSDPATSRPFVQWKVGSTVKVQVFLLLFLQFLGTSSIRSPRGRYLLCRLLIFVPRGRRRKCRVISAHAQAPGKVPERILMRPRNRVTQPRLVIASPTIKRTGPFVHVCSFHPNSRKKCVRVDGTAAWSLPRRIHLRDGKGPPENCDFPRL